MGGDGIPARFRAGPDPRRRTPCDGRADSGVRPRFARSARCRAEDLGRDARIGGRAELAKLSRVRCRHTCLANPGSTTSVPVICSRQRSRTASQAHRSAWNPVLSPSRLVPTYHERGCPPFAKSRVDLSTSRIARLSRQRVEIFRCVRLVPMVIVRAPCRGSCCPDRETGWVRLRWR